MPRAAMAVGSVPRGTAALFVDRQATISEAHLLAYDAMFVGTRRSTERRSKLR